MVFRVLSLFDGISCLRVALGNRDVEYMASEIDENAIKVAKKNYPTIKHIGNVKDVKGYTDIDLLCGGSPCTDLSIAKKSRKGLEGEHSKLFWEYLRILKECKPKYFILENVASMPKKDRDIITKELGVEPIMIDAALVSAQSRKRLFWTNIKGITLPTDRKIFIQSILEDDSTIEDPHYRTDPFVETSTKKEKVMGRIINRRLKDGKRCDEDKTVTPTKVVEERKDGKSGTLTSVLKDNVVITKFVQVGYYGKENASKVVGQALRIYDAKYKATTSGVGYYKTDSGIRKLTPVECERLQSLPDNYTEGISKSARYKALGNGFNVEVIKHILSYIPE